MQKIDACVKCKTSLTEWIRCIVQFIPCLLCCLQIKRGNRQCETLLHDTEIASSLAMCQDRTFQYPVEKLRELWRSRQTSYSLMI